MKTTTEAAVFSRITFVTALILSVVLTPAWAKSDTLSREVSGFLTAIENSYSSENLDFFMELIDPNYKSLPRFKKSLESFFAAAKSAELKLYLDNAIPSKESDEVFVSLHWRRKHRTESGKTRTQRGRCELILKVTDSEYKILRLKNSNPFF